MVALVHIGIHHIGSTQEMEDVGMGLRLISKDVQCVFEESTGNSLIPRYALYCFALLVLFVFILFEYFLLFLHVDAIERRENSRTSILYLNISELPLNKKETGNTLETRGLTYSYTFRTKSKNAHLECKGTKLFPHNQRVRLLFALLYINAA